MLGLGKLYLEGLGVEQNAETATEWLTKAAEAGSEEAAEILTSVAP